MSECVTSRQVCQEIAGELRHMATWLSTGDLTPEQFRDAVLTLEAAKVKRFGFSLTGANSPEGRTHFELRYLKTGKVCASLDFQSGGRELTVQHLGG